MNEDNETEVVVEEINKIKKDELTKVEARFKRDRKDGRREGMYQSKDARFGKEDLAVDDVRDGQQISRMVDRSKIVFVEERGAFLRDD